MENEVKLLSVFAENKPGFLAKATKVLGDEKINIFWFKIIDAEGDKLGLIRFLVDRREDAICALKTAGFAVSTVPVLAIDAENTPGTLAKLADTLYKLDINVRNGSGYYLNGRVVLMIETNQIQTTAKALQENGYKILSEKEIAE